MYKKLAEKAIKSKALVLAFANNSKGYDGHFIFIDLFKRDLDSDKMHIVLTGGKF